MTTPRREIINNDKAVYHCISRCVRRAYLCGFDLLTGRNFDHRKGWVRDRLKLLSEIFLIDVLNYALMSTHAHMMLRIDKKALDALTDKEVARRWFLLYPIGSELSRKEVEDRILLLSKDRKRIRTIRKRLGSISWFMKSLNEYIARKSNKEDDCKGRFWEGRFKCQRLEGEEAVLACALYVDLNPIRAKIAKTPEESIFTSAFERIQLLKNNLRDEWLPPLTDTPNKKGYLSLTLPEYLNILDETGRELVSGKRGAIPSNLAPIFERIGIEPSRWLNTVQYLGRWFSGVVGNYESLSKAANKAGKSWLKGMAPARLAFS